jgi:2'-5' RNA ligase
MSHLTIARTKYIKDKKKFLEELNKIKISQISFNVKKFILKESIPLEGKHIYEDLEKYNLN